MMALQNKDGIEQSRKRGREENEEYFEQRETRLARRRERDRAHSAAAQLYQRDAMKLRQQRRRALETTEQRHTCLERQRIIDEQRRANESGEQRHTRLERQRIIDEERRAVESEKHRQTCLEQQRHLDHLRMTAQTEEERQARLEHNQQQHREYRSRHLQHSLIDQESAHSKVFKFHSKLAELQVNTCSTCAERFPGLTVKYAMPSGNAECSQCHNDKHIPKLFSFINNMHPGPIPPELQVIILW